MISLPNWLPAWLAAIWFFTAFVLIVLGIQLREQFLELHRLRKCLDSYDQERDKIWKEIERIHKKDRKK